MSGDAIILGNGATRKAISLEKLKETRIPVYGCNALYRDTAPNYELPTYLVAIDDKIIEEILASDFPQSRVILPPEEERFEPAAMWSEVMDGAEVAQTPRSNAGMNAIQEAIKHGKNNLLLVGFDFLILNEELAKSNIYSGTNAYGPETAATIEDTRRRVMYLWWLIKSNPDVRFIMVVPPQEKLIGAFKMGTKEEEINLVAFKNFDFVTSDRLVFGDK